MGLVKLGGEQLSKLSVYVRFCSIVFYFALVVCSAWVTGCGTSVSTQDQVREFEKAGPLASETNLATAVGLKGHVGPYRVIAGDILEFHMPAVLRVISSELSQWLGPKAAQEVQPYLVRVSVSGTITMPIVGELHIAGKTLGEIEVCVIDAYYPKYVVSPPMVVCEVKRYQRENERVFTVMGLVNHPDAFPYPADVQYNLMEALAFAGGLDMVANPRYVKVFRQDTTGRIVSATFAVDQKSMADAYRVTVKPGDVIYVDHTLSTRFNKFFADVFHVTVGAEARYREY